MKITLLCSDANHPVNRYLQSWANAQNGAHEVDLLHSKYQLSGGDILFLVSCSEILTEIDRNKFSMVLVLHASDLPKGRGWSPHIWEIIGGAEHITVSLLEAVDKVDCGMIFAKKQIYIPKDSLWNEINDLLFRTEVDLIDLAVKGFGEITPTPQENIDEATYYPKRKLKDSQIDPEKTIAEQFNEIRVCDPYRFPAFFHLHGKKYKLTLEKLDD